MKTQKGISALIMLILIYMGSCKTQSKTNTENAGDAISKSSVEDSIKTDSDITEKYWRLIELNGKSISGEQGLNNDPHFILKKKGNKITGNGSCNSFFGGFEIKSGNRITFSQIGATEMACSNMNVEMEFFKVLNAADNYNLSGDTLILIKTKIAPLAKLVIVNVK